MLTKTLIFNTDWLTKLEQELSQSSSNGKVYPPYNVLEKEDGKIELQVAVAGFDKSDLTVKTEKKFLFIEGKKEEDKEEGKYIAKNIATRQFSLKWRLHYEDVKYKIVEDKVSFSETGLLTVLLEPLVPEEYKKKLIEIV